MSDCSHKFKKKTIALYDFKESQTFLSVPSFGPSVSALFSSIIIYNYH